MTDIPIRNCSTGRDLNFTLRKFVDSARQAYQEFQNLYARDLPCPEEWQEKCRKILPTEVQWGGHLDLFQWLPPPARSEVMMAYVGSEGSSSGFHRCFSSTVALNLLVSSDDRHVVCIGTDFASQKRYDSFMSARGISPHVDWLNLGPDQLKLADFPLYVTDQKVGDLVVFPPATAHQVWNPATLSTKLVWNILHPLSLEVGFRYVQPPFNRLCHPDVARTNLSLACAMLSLIQDTPGIPLPPDLPLLSRLFRQMVHDESIDGTPATPIQLVQIPNGVIATCNFCNTAIWNRHVRCTECEGFDLCLACYLNGRSCEHTQNYVWAEIVPQEQCSRILSRAREILGFQPEEPRTVDRCKTLGTAVNDLMRAKQARVSRLCHLCRIDHPEWKGRRCDKCTAFFCYRGLYRHFDLNSADVLKHSGMWTCPKCKEICNCRCCHFSTAFVKSEKPASKRRVKPFDSRGKTMGFTDNVFDQKRGQRNNHGASQRLPGVAQITGRKRSLTAAGLGGPMNLRKMELPSVESDYSNRVDHRSSREGSDYVMDPVFDNTHPNGTLPSILPSLSSFPDGQSLARSARDRSMTARTSPSRMTALASAAATRANLPDNRDAVHKTTLPPMLPHPLACRETGDQLQPKAFAITGTATATPIQNNSPVPSVPSAPNHLHLIQDDLGRAKMGMTSPTDSSPSTSHLDSTIKQLEDQINSLRRYERDLISLDLEDSHKMLASQIKTLENDLKTRKREKSMLLAERLQQEGFPDIADKVRREMATRPSI